MKRITSIGLTVLALQIGQAEITAAQTAAPSAAVENLMQQAQEIGKIVYEEMAKQQQAAGGGAAPGGGGH